MYYFYFLHYNDMIRTCELRRTFNNGTGREETLNNNAVTWSIVTASLLFVNKKVFFLDFWSFKSVKTDNN